MIIRVDIISKLSLAKCISFNRRKLRLFSEYKLYKKRLNITRGEPIDLKEYAYATSDIDYAKVKLKYIVPQDI